MSGKRTSNLRKNSKRSVNISYTEPSSESDVASESDEENVKNKSVSDRHRKSKLRDEESDGEEKIGNKSGTKGKTRNSIAAKEGRKREEGRKSRSVNISYTESSSESDVASESDEENVKNKSVSDRHRKSKLRDEESDGEEKIGNKSGTKGKTRSSIAAKEGQKSKEVGKSRSSRNKKSSDDEEELKKEVIVSKRNKNGKTGLVSEKDLESDRVSKRKRKLTENSDDDDDKLNESSDSDNSKEKNKVIEKKSKSIENKHTGKSATENTGVVKEKKQVKPLSDTDKDDSNESESDNSDGSKQEDNTRNKKFIKNKRTEKLSEGKTSLAKQKKKVKPVDHSDEDGAKENDNSSESDQEDFKNKKKKKYITNKHIEKLSKENTNLPRQSRPGNPVDYQNKDGPDDDESNSSSESDEGDNVASGEIKNLLCRSCGTAFKTDLLLKSHMRFNHHTFAFKCTICNERYSNHTSFMNHMKSVHPEIGPYPCDYPRCSKSFRKAKELRDHMKEHLSFMCKFCKKGFAIKRAMNIHVQKNHLS